MARRARPAHRARTRSGRQPAALHRHRLGFPARRACARQHAAPGENANQDESSLGHPPAPVDGQRRHRDAAPAPRRDQDTSRDNPHRLSPHHRTCRRARQRPGLVNELARLAKGTLTVSRTCSRTGRYPHRSSSRPKTSAPCGRAGRPRVPQAGASNRRDPRLDLAPGRERTRGRASRSPGPRTRSRGAARSRHSDSA